MPCIERSLAIQSISDTDVHTTAIEQSRSNLNDLLCQSRLADASCAVHQNTSTDRFAQLTNDVVDQLQFTVATVNGVDFARSHRVNNLTGSFQTEWNE
jgi:hypothetical protein